MKMTVTESNFANTMQQHGFSYQGAIALFEYLEEVAPNMEFDAVALRCDFSEYSSAIEAVEDLNRYEVEESNNDNDEESWKNLTDEEKTEKAEPYFQEDTVFLKFNGGVIIQNF